VDILRVTQLHRLGAVEVDMDVDEFVPLRFRSYREPLGVGYVRLGNNSTTLFEMAVEPGKQVVRGLTVTSIRDVSSWPSFDVVDVEEGMPALSTSFEGARSWTCRVTSWSPLALVRSWSSGRTSADVEALGLGMRASLSLIAHWRASGSPG
jgi:hypothetical protein